MTCVKELGVLIVIGNKAYQCGAIALGGIVAPSDILNTLNGTKEKPNLDINYFSSYTGPFGDANGTLDFSNTGITHFGVCWFDRNKTIIIPSCFKSVIDLTFSGVTVDYSNVDKCDDFFGNGAVSVRTENFKGYKTVKSWANPLSVLGENTNILWFGINYDGGKNKSLGNLNFNSVISKAPNIKELRLCRVSGLDNIYILNDLGLTTLEIINTPIYNLTSSENNVFEAIGESLDTLKITDCDSFNGLEGLSSLDKITELDFTGDRSLGNTVNITGAGEISTCEYIVNSLPELNKVTLKGTGITNFTGLTSKGFKETGSGSGIFTKSN